MSNDYDTGMLPPPSLGKPVHSVLANEIYDEVESMLENELERGSFTSRSHQQKQSVITTKTISHRDSTYDPSTTTDHAGPSNRYQRSGSTSISESTFTSPSAIWRKSPTVSDETDQDHVITEYDAATAAQLREHNLLFARSPTLSRWQLESIGDLRRSETQFNNLLLRVQADEGNNYKKLKQEFRELQENLIDQHGYMLQELNMCATKELTAFSGTFGLCVKTGVALEKLRRKKKLNIPFFADVAKN
ncbi:6759_t:CDS:2 [Ambispora leptoticha]|uniref:6759_t:CDS:1 n=1 Tax=Ambispora leptoticha TaxID=144679 RepID=A0A9N9C8Z5_9GLOM|nr:6759_t:CDS:2 [Ambispora leptoticha]